MQIMTHPPETLCLVCQHSAKQHLICHGVVLFVKCFGCEVRGDVSWHRFRAPINKKIQSKIHDHKRQWVERHTEAIGNGKRLRTRSKGREYFV